MCACQQPKVAIPKREILAMVTPVEIEPLPTKRMGTLPTKRPNSIEMKSWTNLAPKKV